MAALALLCGCGSLPERGAGGGGGGIAAVNVITAPIALNLDNIPGADGVSLKVYGNTASNPKAIPIRDGEIEIVMIDGLVQGRSSIQPLRTWSFPASELRAREFEAAIGTGYDFILPWGANRPQERLITIVVRYISPAGRVVSSRPSSVTVSDR